MKKFSILVLGLAIGSTAPLLAQDPKPKEPAQEPALPAPPPRVVGQAQSQEELDAYNAIEAAPTVADKIRLGTQFLADFPEGGLTSYVHYSLANAYRQNGEPEKFIEHGEKALIELPQLADVMAYLAFFYAETGETSKATDRAQQALKNLSTMEKPSQFKNSQWTAQKYILSGEAHYALGRVHLTEAMSAGEAQSKVHLQEAVTELKKAIEESPNHEYAAFRLAEAYSRRQEYELAIDAYARTIALGGVIGQFAQEKLQKVYEAVHNNTDGMQDVIAKQKLVIQAELQEREKMMQEMDVAVPPEQTPPPVPSSKPPVLNL